MIPAWGALIGLAIYATCFMPTQRPKDNHPTTCRIGQCSLPAEPGELCWFHKAPRDPDFDDLPLGYEDRLASYREAAREN